MAGLSGARGRICPWHVDGADGGGRQEVLCVAYCSGHLIGAIVDGGLAIRFQHHPVAAPYQQLSGQYVCCDGEFD